MPDPISKIVARNYGITTEPAAIVPTSAIDVQDEGIPVAGSPFTTINIVGAGAIATPGAPGVVDVTIPGGGGVVALLGDVTGPSAANTVTAIQNAPVPAGPYTPGTLLQAVGAALFTLAALNLANPASVAGILPAANQAPQAMAGDVSGTTAVSVVQRVNGATVPIAGALTPGNVLQVTGIATLAYGAVNLAGGPTFVTGLLPAANQSPQTLAGDATGTTAAAVVARVNGATVPIAGALTTGNVLQVTGAATLGYAPVNVGGGAAFVIGVLPTGNQAPQTLAGDATGTTAAAVVARVNGATVPAAGALTTGNVLQVTGAATLAYAAINLAGGAAFVTGVLPTANQAAQSLSGDVTGTTAASIVQTLTGTANLVTVPAATHIDFGAAPAASGVLRFSNNTALNWRDTGAGTIAGFTVNNANQVIVGSGAQTNTARLTCSNGAGGAHEWETATGAVNGRNGGNLWFQHTTAGATTIQSLGVAAISFSAAQGVYNYGGAGTMTWNVNATSGFNIVVSSSAASPTWTQTASTTGAGTNTAFRAQGGLAGNNNGGRWDLQGGARTGTGLKGGVALGLNGTTEAMVEIVEVAAGRRATVLNRAALITTTQLPANTGDLITYLGDAATVPTADAVGASTLYSNTSVFSFRNGAANGGNRIEFTCVSSATATQGAAAIPALAQEFMDISYNGNSRKIALFLP